MNKLIMLLLYTIQSLYKMILNMNYKRISDEQIKVNEFILNNNIIFFV